jgi:hypothetical protein
MQTKVQLIYNDVCTVCILALIIFNGTDNGLKFFWVFMLIYFLGKQIIAHRNNYKLNHRLF